MVTTVVLPKDYHLFEELENKKIEVMSTDEALRQDIRALRIGILNIMPKAESYEFNLLFPLGRSVLQIDPVWIKLKTHQYTTTDKAHLERLYVTFDQAISKKLDGLIITGAPVEEIPFEEVRYWDEIVEILDYARKNIISTLGICWGGLALAKMMGIDKVQTPKKIFGIFESENLDRKHPVTGELDDLFFCPQSRHAGIPDDVMRAQEKAGNIRLLAYGGQAGYFIFESSDRRFLMHLGHPEYNSRRLQKEALRDQKEGRKDVDPPVNYDINRPINRWRGHRNEFFTQWIKYIYENTDLSI